MTPVVILICRMNHPFHNNTPHHPQKQPHSPCKIHHLPNHPTCKPCLSHGTPTPYTPMSQASTYFVMSFWVVLTHHSRFSTRVCGSLFLSGHLYLSGIWQGVYIKKTNALTRLDYICAQNVDNHSRLHC